MKCKRICVFDTKDNVENCPATSVALVNAMDNTKRESPENENKKV